MKTCYCAFLMAFVGIFAGTTHAQSSEKAQILKGRIGASSQYGSGWLVLDEPINLYAGDRLKVSLGGTAQKVVLRLLAKGQSPDTSVGVIGGALDVPDHRKIEIVLSDDHPDVVQISVHGGPNPWGEYPLGDDNGPATIASVALVRKQ